MDVNGLRFWMLSQLNDWLPPWRATIAYLAGQGIVDVNGAIQIVQSGGKSDAAQPAWSTTAGETTQDGSITWVHAGPGTWAAKTAFAAGQYIVNADGNLQQASSVTGDGTTGGTEPAWPQAMSASVVDNNITWTCKGAWQAGLFYCNQSKRLQLRSERTDAPPNEDFPTVTNLVETVPIAQDQFDTYARWDATSAQIVAGGSGPSNATGLDEVAIYAAPPATVTDLVMGYDGILYIAAGGALVMVDRRNRWANFTFSAPDFKFWRLAALPQGGVLALDRDTPQLGQVSGQPLPAGPMDVANPGVLRPCQNNPDPPRIVARFALPTSERFVAVAPMDPTQTPMQFALLSWDSNSKDNENAWLRIFSGVTATAPRLQLEGVRLPYAITWLGGTKLAVLATNLKEALIYDLSNAGDEIAPAGETYVLAAQNVGPFEHTFNLPPYYANIQGALPLVLPLLPLSLNSVAASGATSPAGPSIIDSGTAQTTWHRMFLEAILPPKCGAIIWLAAADTPAGLVDPGLQWFPHIVGDVNLASIPAALIVDTPVAAWQRDGTEVPFGPTLLDENPIRNLQGLFMVLVQRAQKAVRSLRGRFLAVRIQLNGDKRSTPEIAGLRVYGSRFSYVQNYLPEIYREQAFGAAAETPGQSTRRDFFERFVDTFEAQLTQIENRIANAYLLTRSESVPESALGWLGSWIGIPQDNYPPDRSRARLQAMSYLYKWRGTTRGVAKALDVATNGMASRGAIIVIEDFRLRHIFATILGADLANQGDPLLPGFTASSNSYVGDTLFLGNPAMQAEIQALYITDLNIAGSAEAVQAFYDSLALRMTVFVHNQVENVNLNLVRSIVETEKPAHVRASVKLATQPFMIGLASLLGINTYLGPTPQPGTATVDLSTIGRYDVVQHLPSLDPRTEAG